MGQPVPLTLCDYSVSGDFITLFSSIFLEQKKARKKCDGIFIERYEGAGMKNFSPNFHVKIFCVPFFYMFTVLLFTGLCRKKIDCLRTEFHHTFCLNNTNKNRII